MSQKRYLECSISWQYLAGFTDGEGTIGYGGPGKGQAKLSWAQSVANSVALDAVADFLDTEGISYSYKEYDASGNFADRGLRYKIITVGGQQQVKQCLENMLPFLVLKRERSVKALAHLGKKIQATNRRKVFCKEGHARTKKNTYRHPDGKYSICLKCHPTSKKLRVSNVN
jgi:hypothetical protein